MAERMKSARRREQFSGSSAAVLTTLMRTLGDLRGRRVAIFGLRAHTRDSDGPGGLELASSLLSLGVAVSGWDPDGPAEVAADAALGERALIVDEPFLAALDADVLVVTEPWSAARWAELEGLRPLMSRPFFLDAATDHPFFRRAVIGEA